MRLSQRSEALSTLKWFVVSLIIGALVASCSVKRESGFVERIRSGYYPYRVMKRVKPGYVQYGEASWYGSKFQGRRTADGEIYNMYAYTAAHKTLPFGTCVEVTNLNNGRKTVVRINDRGPFVKNRVIDLSYAAARDIGMIPTGTAPVKIRVVGMGGRCNRLNDYSKRGNVTNQMDGGYRASSYAIQIGSFRKLINALRMRDRYAAYWSSVRIERVTVDGDVYYRVLVGNFSTKEEAKEFAVDNILPHIGNFVVVH